MGDLVDFLMARIAEDEAEARIYLDREMFDGGWTDEHGAQVLAECEAKRRIIEACTWMQDVRTEVRRGVYEYRPVRRIKRDDSDDPEAVLKALAAVYATHPNYDEAWRWIGSVRTSSQSCVFCDGTGSLPDADHPCDWCNGSGEIR